MAVTQTEILTRHLFARRKLAEIRQFKPLQDYLSRQLASTDRLTGLMSRLGFLARSSDLLEHSPRSPLGLAAIMLDIDHFKKFNDEFGHAAGDDALRTVARILLENLRPMDLCGRYGGEEFIVLLRCTALAEACRVAERVRDSVQANPILVGGVEIPLTVSLGVAFQRMLPSRVDVLISHADQALCQAKLNGRDCWVCEERS
jgi:diguanylate cyclase (GGDEF)-like protein